MKLHRLELEGFGPFLTRQSVDFDAFDADGVFLISGRTGAGKSSILDGVCYALYGTAPRYDGGDRGLRSDHAGPDQATEVRLEFTAAGRRWRVTRTPEYDRPKARGDGMTTQKSSVLVEELTGEQWIARATKQREAADVIDDVLGLTRDQFQQVILLAQNRFAEFLLAKNDDRQALLRSLFGSRRFEEYEKAFDERRRAAQHALDGDVAALGALLAHAEAIVADATLGVADDDDAAHRSTADRIETLERAVPRARYRADESTRRRDVAREAHDDALARYGERSALRRRQEERIASRRAFAALEEQAPAVSAMRSRLERARAADIVRAPIDAARRATESATAARGAASTARAAWVSRGETDAPVGELRALVEQIAGDLAVWARAAEAERMLPELHDLQERADRTLTTLHDGLAELEKTAVQRTERRAAVETALADAERETPNVELARARLDDVERQLAAAREAEHLAPLARAADEAHLAAVSALDERTAAVAALLRRRLAGYAGELGATLLSGEACPVCGSCEHPHPAAPSDDPVTDEMVATAEAAVAEAARSVAAASAAAVSAREAHRDASTRADGRTPKELDERRAAARRVVTDAEDAAGAAARLRAELSDLDDADRAARGRRDEATDSLAAVREQRALVAQEISQITATLADARGEHPTVAERMQVARGRRDLALALADGGDELARAESAAAAAVADRDERIAASPFADEEEAVAALVETAEQERLAADLHRHDVAFASERERLRVLETELAGAPDEPVDLEEAAALADAARQAWNTAVEEAARDAEVAARLAEAVERAAERHTASADRTAELDLIAGLADAVAGRTDSRMDLETFVLAAELEEIVAAANLRLDAMSSGRYRLMHSDAVARHRAASGLGLAVFDVYTGQTRPAHSLSGGETFLASLALALGLAEIVTARSGGVRLDTLFIDEGFGSLDDETLELAMSTLDELRQGGRTVGLISHVATMKERLPAQLTVQSTPHGPSRILQPTTTAPVA